MIHVLAAADGPVATFNLGTRTTTSVTRIADVVSETMGLEPEYEYTGGDRGWTGDVPKMRLSIEARGARLGARTLERGRGRGGDRTVARGDAGTDETIPVGRDGRLPPRAPVTTACRPLGPVTALRRR